MTLLGNRCLGAMAWRCRASIRLVVFDKGPGPSHHPAKARLAEVRQGYDELIHPLPPQAGFRRLIRARKKEAVS